MIPESVGTARIAVTGIGAITAIASNVKALSRALRAGETGVRTVSLFDVTDQRTKIAAEIQGFDPREHAPAAQRETVTRSDALAVVAAREALAMAGLDTPSHRRSMGVILGGTTGGMLETESFFASVVLGRPHAQPVTWLVSHPLNAPTDFLANVLGLEGTRRTVCTACSSGTNAIASGIAYLRANKGHAILVGGVDALCRLTFSGFNALGAIDPNPCRPFDVSRAGLTLGEGAGFLVLERLDDARARGVTVLSEIRSVGLASEAHHITNPLATGEGAARAIRMALDQGGIRAEQIDYINAHGTATPLNDAMECAAIHEVFGSRSGDVLVSSTKSMTGHTLGAAGALEAVITVMALAEQFVPPTATLSTVDPRCEQVRHVTQSLTSLDRPLRCCLSNSFGFGGSDAVVCISTTEFGDSIAMASPRSNRSSVVVTGVGALGPHSDRDALLEHLAGSASVLKNEDPSAGMQQPGRHLDPGRSRRLDRLSLAVTETGRQAIEQAAVRAEHSVRTGACVGTAWGSLDPSAAFIRRVSERGARLAPPADFPGLVLSAAVGHLSIYHGLRGPTITTAALGVSGEHALALAIDEIVADRADFMLVGGVEERNPVMLDIIDANTSLWPERDLAAHPRTEFAACVLIEPETLAQARGATPLARIVELIEAPGTGDALELA